MTKYEEMHTRPLGSQDGRENIETMMNDAAGNELYHSQERCGLGENS